jgi:hypothetical protein
VIYREVARKLRRLRCQEEPRRGGGSHRKWRNPTTGQYTMVPDWGAVPAWAVADLLYRLVALVQPPGAAQVVRPLSVALDAAAVLARDDCRT